ncbi:hypothetical protein HOH87_08600 [bacterium]|jgi:hypothetical protein|nr:hypothetical protein [bacterium]
MNKVFLALVVGGVAVCSTHSMAASMSDIELKGDLRLRVQNEKMESGVNRSRNRLRFRLGGESAISDKSKVSFGVATGGTDARSTNQTLQDSFQTPDLRLDYAYLTHKLSDKLTVTAGKMKNPLWTPTDLLWDSDINPDGLAVNYKSSVGIFNGGVTVAYFGLDELAANTNDPSLVTVQKTVNWKVNKNTQANTAVTYYSTINTKGIVLDNSSNSNTGATTGLDNDFSVIVLSGQVSMTNQFGLAQISPFAEYVTNSNQSENNTGYIVGVKFGDKKVNAERKWQGKVAYRELETDAWLDIFPNADAYGGATNVKGYDASLTYGLSKKTSVSVNYFNMDTNTGVQDANSIVQLDLNIKF